MGAVKGVGTDWREGREGFEVLGFGGSGFGVEEGKKGEGFPARISPESMVEVGLRFGGEGGWVKGDGFGEGMKGWVVQFWGRLGRFRQRGKGVKVLRI
ncbi:uncharacterized protein G2W53_007784 [Senna tora]|uniref:Uncharacterized protein n=1 Tax=Senna tora TaxID=362788 RepID=A0A834X6X9_9FABA|nr:uncharacterized protein G2W53_007784 [Senna tora]